jgi:hypothetical protein
MRRRRINHLRLFSGELGGSRGSSTLAVLSSPDFPQLLRLAIDRAVTRVISQQDESHLDCCSYESPESRYGACDSEPCCDLATVHHLQSERDFCAKHFRQLTISQALEDLEVSR